MMTLTAVLCCGMVMSSCSKSGDNGGTPAAPDTTPVSVKIIYGAKVEADMLANADVEIEYLDASGNKQTEKMTATTWQKEVTAKLPAKVEAKMILKKKSGVDYANVGKIRIGGTVDYGYIILNKAGDVLSQYGWSDTYSSQDSSGPKFEMIIDKSGADYSHCSGEFDAQGKKK